MRSILSAAQYLGVLVFGFVLGAGVSGVLGRPSDDMKQPAVNEAKLAKNDQMSRDTASNDPYDLSREIDALARQVQEMERMAPAADPAKQSREETAGLKDLFEGQERNDGMNTRSDESLADVKSKAPRLSVAASDPQRPKTTAGIPDASADSGPMGALDGQNMVASLPNTWDGASLTISQTRPSRRDVETVKPATSKLAITGNAAVPDGLSRTAPKRISDATSSSSSDGEAIGERAYAVHLASLSRTGNIDAAANDLKARFPVLLGDNVFYRMEVPNADADLSFTRLVSGRYADKADADTLCKRLRAQGQYCSIVSVRPRAG